MVMNAHIIYIDIYIYTIGGVVYQKWSSNHVKEKRMSVKKSNYNTIVSMRD